MKRKNDPGAHMPDNRPGQDLQRRQQTRQSRAEASDLRLASDIRRAYQDEINQDRRSLQRVFARLMRDQAPARPKILSLPAMTPQPQRISVPHKHAVQMLAQPERGWKRRLALFAALLCTLVLTGGFLILASATRANSPTSTGSTITPTPARQSTTYPAAKSIPLALLTASDRGNSEGIGPGLSGLVPSRHFQVGQKFWLFFLVDASGGTVSAKWYADGRFYHVSSLSVPAWPTPPPAQASSSRPTPSPNSPGDASPLESNFSMTYDRQATARVELYWNGQLATTLSFVVTA